MFENKKKTDVMSLRLTEARTQLIERYRAAKVAELGRPLSLSEALLLALEDRAESIQETIELLELRQNPTLALWGIRQKEHLGNKLSRPEWLFLLEHVRIGLDEDMLLPPNSNIVFPTPESARCAIKVLQSLYSAASDIEPDIQSDLYHLLGGRFEYEKPLSTADKSAIIPSLIDRAVEPFIAPDMGKNFPRIGAALLLVARNMQSTDNELHTLLSPHFPTLWKIAARGHFIRYQKPIRIHTFTSPAFEGKLAFPTRLYGEDVEINVMPQQYELVFRIDLGNPATSILEVMEYPQVIALRRAIIEFDGQNHWMSRYCHVTPNKEHNFVTIWLFKGNMRLRLTQGQWKSLRQLTHAAWSNPIVQAWTAELERQYGEQG